MTKNKGTSSFKEIWKNDIPFMFEKTKKKYLDGEINRVAFLQRSFFLIEAYDKEVLKPKKMEIPLSLDFIRNEIIGAMPNGLKSNRDAHIAGSFFHILWLLGCNPNQAAESIKEYFGMGKTKVKNAHKKIKENDFDTVITISLMFPFFNEDFPGDCISSELLFKIREEKFPKNKNKYPEADRAFQKLKAFLLEYERLALDNKDSVVIKKFIYSYFNENSQKFRGLATFHPQYSQAYLD